MVLKIVNYLAASGKSAMDMPEKPVNNLNKYGFPLIPK